MTDPNDFFDDVGDIIEMEPERAPSRALPRILIAAFSAAILLGSLWTATAVIEGYLGGARLGSAADRPSLKDAVQDQLAGVVQPVMDYLRQQRTAGATTQPAEPGVADAAPADALSEPLVDTVPKVVALSEELAEIGTPIDVDALLETYQALADDVADAAAAADDEPLGADPFAPHEIDIAAITARRSAASDTAAVVAPHAEVEFDGLPAIEAQTREVPVADIAPVTATADQREVAELQPPDPLEIAAPPDVPAGAAEAAPAWRIQLAALASHADADAAWPAFASAHRDLLAELTLHVERAELARGIFYRVQAGPLRDRAAAAALCRSLKSRNQDCLVVAP